MKKLLLLAITAILSLSAWAEPTVKEIFEKYDKVTGLDQSKGTTTMKMEMSIDVVGQAVMPCKVIIGTEGRMKINMNMMGLDMVVVSNGKQCWATVPGQGVVEIPVAEASKIIGSLKMGEMGNSMKSYEKFFDFTYDGEQGDHYIVTGVVKPGAIKDVEGVASNVYYFNKKTGLIDKSIATIDQEGKKTQVNVELTDYRKSGKYTIPMSINTTNEGIKANIKIESVDFEYEPVDTDFKKPE